MNNAIEEIEKNDIGKIEKDVFLSKYTTYRVGGLAKYIVYPKNAEKLVTLIKILKKNNVMFKILGNGSNLLFSDKQFPGILIKLNEFNDVEFIGNKVLVGAGYPIIKLSLLCAKHSLTGLEFASGIPGTVGGALFMNAGAYNSDMGYVVQNVKVLTPDLRIITLENKELDFHYRTSFFKKHPDYICLETLIRLEKGNKSAIEDLIKERRKRRVISQPLEYPSAGSVFRNPPDNYAGKLIEDLGFKGLRKGGAMVSEKHANFIVNAGGASSKDIKDLIDYVHDKVLEKYNIDLKVEQEFVNF